MKARKVIISAAIALLFVGAFAQKPVATQPKQPAKAATVNTHTLNSKQLVSVGKSTPQGVGVANKAVQSNTTGAKSQGVVNNTTPQPQTKGEKTIVNIKSRRMFPIQIGDSTVHAFVGNVVAYHNGTIIQCDSAVRYHENKIECFKEVLINKDNIYVYGDRLIYNRITSIAEVFSPLVKLIDDDATLYTYSFRYNTLDNIGTYSGGGTMHKGEQMLFESNRGYYYGETRDAVGVGNVELRDSVYLIKSDSLGMNLNTEIATFYKNTTIWNKKNEILSANSGWYNTKTDHYHFTSNAYVLSDKQEIWADDIDYRADTEDAILKRDVQIYDKEQNVLAFGDYVKYLGLSGDAMLAENPSIISLSEGQDSVFMRADSIFIHVIDSTSVYSADYIDKHKSIGENSTEEQLISKSNSGDEATKDALRTKDELSQSNGMLQDSVQQPDSLIKQLGKDSKLDSLSVSENTSEKELTKAQKKEEKQKLKEQKRLQKQLLREQKDSIRNAKRIAKYGLSKKDKAIALKDSITSIEVKDSLLVDSVLMGQKVGGLSDSLSVVTAAPDSIASTQAAINKKETTEESKERVIVGYYDVKIFKKDLQAVCDSLVAFSRDTTAHLHRNPVIWNGDSQIKAELAVVYTKNESLDKAVFTGGAKHGNPVMSIELDSKHYNQITGKVIESIFKDGEIDKTDVNGNAQTLYYMQDDGTRAYQGFMVMNCSNMTFFFIEQNVDEIVFRGNPDCVVYPMHLIPPTQPQTFPNFVWEGDRRPKKVDVFNRIIRDSQRELYESLPKPMFPITLSINDYKQSIITAGFWKDRDDEVTLDALEYVQRLLSQGQVVQ